MKSQKLEKKLEKILDRMYDLAARSSSKEDIAKAKKLSKQSVILKTQIDMLENKWIKPDYDKKQCLFCGQPLLESTIIERENNFIPITKTTEKTGNLEVFGGLITEQTTTYFTGDCDKTVQTTLSFNAIECPHCRYKIIYTKGYIENQPQYSGDSYGASYYRTCKIQRFFIDAKDSNLDISNIINRYVYLYDGKVYDDYFKKENLIYKYSSKVIYLPFIKENYLFSGEWSDDIIEKKYSGMWDSLISEYDVKKQFEKKPICFMGRKKLEKFEKKDKKTIEESALDNREFMFLLDYIATDCINWHFVTILDEIKKLMDKSKEYKDAKFIVRQKLRTLLSKKYKGIAKDIHGGSEDGFLQRIGSLGLCSAKEVEMIKTTTIDFRKRVLKRQASWDDDNFDDEILAIWK